MIDAVESWIVLLPLPIQILLLLAVFLPLCWLAARAVDPVVEWVLRPHTARSRRREDVDR
ncbi:hypothetical protein [Nakamurella deserti]|uniref:hypothetical protein n=1 Tax=Nakamurella deserti TaxID=2164074 RepID=UPI00130052CB|nr:hypothetical protein [Nakamurella deserti]